MGAENSSLSQLCSGSQTSIESQIESQVLAETKPKTKPKSNTQNYEINDNYDLTTDYESDITDQKYNEQQYTKLERELKIAQNETHRVITQYNLQLDTSKSKFTSLQEKFHIELQQKSVLLQQLQDTIKQHETLKTAQITAHLEHKEEINIYKVSLEKIQQRFNEHNKKQIEQNKQYEIDIHKYKECICNLEEKINGYNRQIIKQKEDNIQLENRINILNKQLKDEKQNINAIETLQYEFDEYKQLQQMEINNKINDIKSLENEIMDLKNDIIKLKNKELIKDEMNETLKLQLNKANELQSVTVTQINALKSEIIVLKSVNDEFEKKNEEIIINKMENKKEKLYTNTQRQMEILYDENAKVKSLFLCTFIQSINGKEMSFIKWLSTHLNNKTVKKLWTKVKSNKANGHIFVELLALTTMIYKTTLFQKKTNTKDRPNINTIKLKSYVEHLGVWCIRNKGINTNEKINICVKMESGEIVNQQVYKYKLRLTQNEFANNLAEWVKEYIENQGALENVI